MIDHSKFTKFVNYDELSLEYHKVTHDILLNSDKNHALDIIFQYWRKKGFPHYTTHT